MFPSPPVVEGGEPDPVEEPECEEPTTLVLAVPQRGSEVGMPLPALVGKIVVRTPETVDSVAVMVTPEATVGWIAVEVEIRLVVAGVAALESTEVTT